LSSQLKQKIKQLLLGAERRPTRILGGLARGVWMDLDRTSHLRLICGFYEPSIRSFLKRQTRRAAVYYDIGSNVGYYSLLFASQEPVRSVHAFEPNPRLTADFERNMQLNPGLSPKITLHRLALGNGMAGVKLDDYIREQKLPPPDLVKIDVDGPEAEILRGSSALLAAKQTAWMVETHSAPLELEVEALFRDAGYQTRFPPEPFWLRWFPEERMHLPNRHLVALPPALGSF
jgi:methyltransferase FkbM-like protein